MADKPISKTPSPPAESRGALFIASPNAYVTYAQILDLMDGLPLDKQQAICRYLADHVTKKAHGQQSKAPVLNGKRVKSNERER